MNLNMLLNLEQQLFQIKCGSWRSTNWIIFFCYFITLMLIFFLSFFAHKNIVPFHAIKSFSSAVLHQQFLYVTGWWAASDSASASTSSCHFIASPVGFWHQAVSYWNNNERLGQYSQLQTFSWCKSYLNVEGFCVCVCEILGLSWR